MLVAGSGGLATEIIDTLLERMAKEEVFFFDDRTLIHNEKKLDHFTILRTAEEAKKHFEKDGRFVIAVGNPFNRKMLFDKCCSWGGKPFTIISNQSSIGNFNNKIENSVLILQHSIIENCNVIGENSLVHVGAFISHDVSIGSHCEIAPFAKLLGNVRIGSLTTVGAGVIVLPKITVGNNCIIGAGAVVTKNIPDNSVAVGIPARVVKQNPVTA